MLMADNRKVPFCQIDHALIGSETFYNHIKLGINSDAVSVFTNKEKLRLKKNKISRYMKTSSMGNPAVLYCLQRKGRVINYSNGKNYISICKLQDNSQISSWTLFNGAGNSYGLANALTHRVDQRIGKNLE